MRSYADSLDAELDVMAEKQRNNTATKDDLDRYETLMLQIGQVHGSLQGDADPHGAEYQQWLAARHERANVDANHLYHALGIVSREPTTPPLQP